MSQSHMSQCPHCGHWDEGKTVRWRRKTVRWRRKTVRWQTETGALETNLNHKENQISSVYWKRIFLIAHNFAHEFE